MKNKTVSTILAVAVLVCLCVPSAAAAASMDNFKPVNVYNGNFIDVSQEWYYDNVESCYEYNLFIGNGDNTFAPNSNLTVAEAIVVADRLHSIYHTGKSTLTVQGDPWYTVFVEYAVENGIIKEDDFTDYEANVTRAQMAYIFAGAIPESEFEVINDVTSLPDVSSDAKYFNEILRLYKAGILIGNDEYGTFMPDNSILRCEAAAIISRLAIPDLRLTFVQYTTFKVGNNSSYATIYAPARYVRYEQNGIEYFEDPVLDVVIASDVNTNDMYSGLSIGAIFTAGDVIQLYKDNFAQSDEPIEILDAQCERADFGSVSAYRTYMLLDYSGYTMHAYTYLFIHNNSLFELTFTSVTNDQFIKTMVNNVKVMGVGVSNKL